MALFRVTVKQNRRSNGIPLEKGMSVEIASKFPTPFANGGHEVIDAFMRTYGIDLRKAGGGSISGLKAYLETKKLN